MALKFFVETHIAISITDQLRAKGIDVVRADEIGLSHEDDETLLGFAIAQQRVMLTHDADFLVLHSRYMATGRSHYGIMYALPDLQGVVGVIVKAVVLWDQAVEAGAAIIELEVWNQAIYIS